jgi:GNAT superfamily N-acetyltransferase
MRRPEPSLVGPRGATPADIPMLNRLFSDSFTERYHRDGLVGVRVPQLNPNVWRYAMRDAGDGAMLWYDEHDELIAFNMVHRSGIEGWMGPLAVRTERQERGVGRAIVTAAIDWLTAQGATVLGLETMPRTVDNIGFYSRLGFAPEHLTVTMVRDVRPQEEPAGAVRLSSVPARARADLIEACRARMARTAPGYDYSREMDLTFELDIGDTVVLQRRSDVEAFAVCHAAALAAGRNAEELSLRLAALVPGIARGPGNARPHRDPMPDRAGGSVPGARRTRLRRAVDRSAHDAPRPRGTAGVGGCGAVLELGNLTHRFRGTISPLATSTQPTASGTCIQPDGTASPNNRTLHSTRQVIPTITKTFILQSLAMSRFLTSALPPVYYSHSGSEELNY